VESSKKVFGGGRGKKRTKGALKEQENEKVFDSGEKVGGENISHKKKKEERGAIGKPNSKSLQMGRGKGRARREAMKKKPKYKRLMAREE